MSFNSVATKAVKRHLYTPPKCILSVNNVKASASNVSNVLISSKANSTLCDHGCFLFRFLETCSWIRFSAMCCGLLEILVYALLERWCIRNMWQYLHFHEFAGGSEMGL